MNTSHALFGTFMPSSSVLHSVEKASEKKFHGIVLRKERNFRNILIVGTGHKSEQFTNYLLTEAPSGLRIAGFLREQQDPPLESFMGYPVLGSIQDLVQVCARNTVEEVIFCLAREKIPEIARYLIHLEESGITIRTPLDFSKPRRIKPEFHIFHSATPTMAAFYQKVFNPDRLFLKRCLDIAGALVGLAITTVLSPFITLAVKLDSPGPVFFGQKRVGENGRIFTCWKFRSMTVDAEERKKDLSALNEVNGAMFKIRNDPRLTAVGRFLRKTSIDELPQFWNVLRGEMSLVGPRPPTPEEVRTYAPWHRRRISIKPGMTGLWQVSGRNEIKDFDEVVRLDLTYIDNWSLMLDVKLILKTFMVMFTGRGSV